MKQPVMKPTKTLSSILWIGISTLLGGVISYLYHPVMLQYLSLETFGEFGSMVGLFNILGVLTMGVSLFLVREISRAREDQSHWSSIYHRGLPRGLVIGAAVFLIVSLLSPLLASYLGLTGGVWPLILVASSLILSFGGVMLGAFVQGAEKFQFLALSGVLGAIVKLGLGWLLVWSGWGLYGAIGGFVGAGVFGLLLTRWYVRRYIVRGPRQESDDFLEQELSRQLPQMVPFLVLVLGLSFLMNSDIIIAKNIFDETTAGGYAALSVIAKFVVFVGAAIETVYYPKITQHSSAHLVPTVRLRNASVLMIIMTLGAIGGSWLLGGGVLQIMKPELVSYAPLLVWVVTMAAGYVFVNFYAKVLVAWHDKYVLWVVGGGWCLWVALLYLGGVNDLLMFVQSLLVIECVMAVILWIRIRHHQSFSLPTDQNG